MADEFDAWRRALKGQKLDLGKKGQPPSGYFRRKADKDRWEAIAIWREQGNLQCARNIFGDGSKMDADEIDELFQQPNMFAVPWAVFDRVFNHNDPWPEIYTTGFTTADIKAGAIWTEAWATQKLAQAKIEADPPKQEAPAHDLGAASAGPAQSVEPQIGHNNPPDEPTTLADKIKAKARDLKKLLSDWGGAPRTTDENNMVGVYVNKFKDYENEAVDKHKTEKDPHLKAGREVDAKWFAPVRDVAVAERVAAKKIVDAFTKAENDRLAEEARKLNEDAKKRAEAEAKITGEPVEVAEVAPQTYKSTARGRAAPAKEWRSVDHAKFCASLCALEHGPPEALIETLNKIAKQMGKAGSQYPGMELKEI